MDRNIWAKVPLKTPTLNHKVFLSKRLIYKEWSIKKIVCQINLRIQRLFLLWFCVNTFVYKNNPFLLNTQHKVIQLFLLITYYNWNIVYTVFKFNNKIIQIFSTTIYLEYQYFYRLLQINKTTLLFLGVVSKLFSES